MQRRSTFLRVLAAAALVPSLALAAPKAAPCQLTSRRARRLTTPRRG
jgi:hypothetical protein